MGVLIIWEGADPKVSEMLYRAVVQVLLLFGDETWVLLVAMERKVEGTYTGFLLKIMGKRMQRLPDRTWETPRAEAVREEAGI